jgi:hypothetical protein
MKLVPAATAPLVTAVALLAAGCGSSTHSGNSSSNRPEASGQLSVAAAFSRCVRAHGLPNYPDPTAANPKITAPQLGVSQSQYRAAMTPCTHLLPNDGGSQETAAQARTRLADELSFAKCMRSRGVARFPDPTAQGDLSIHMVEAQGIDVHSPAVLRVVTACLPASHGALTPAKVREALNRAGG